MDNNSNKLPEHPNKDLNVYTASYSLAMDVFWMTKKFPKEDLYSLTDQIRRASWRKVK